jgi:hypothetical protein
LRRRERSLPGSLLSLSHVIHRCLGQLLRGLRRRLRILPDKIVHRLFDDLPEHIGVFHPFGKGIARAVRRGQNLYGLCLGLCCGHLRHPNNLSRSLRDESVDGFGSAARPRVCAAALHRARHLDPHAGIVIAILPQMSRRSMRLMLPTNVASMKSSRQFDPGPVGRLARRGGHKCAACLEGG